jgi:hypothetical protein
MNFNLFGFNLEVSFNRSYFYEVLVFPCDLNGEIDEDRAYVFGGHSRLQACYQGWRNARMQAKGFCMDFSFVVRRRPADIEDPRPEDWEVVRFRSIETKTQVAFFSR